MSVLFFCYIHSKEEAEGWCLAISDLKKKKLNVTLQVPCSTLALFEKIEI